ncbi:hypothetical protein G6M78_01640 [Agrobacterium tumefaciens]|uniref:hypothetical protein n=1 Tax=Agrobacterium tumefaciens TaxID=358 RepID=UPI00157496DA|nr:hypothetical protein [Agrobacterium tumefaciens]NTE53777.1 hypothetical protein [Agrobacterium tumefaciens]NTE72662.1 hypothetical protein [Agrobacterium tumefaciens]
MEEPPSTGFSCWIVADQGVAGTAYPKKYSKEQKTASKTCSHSAGSHHQFNLGIAIQGKLAIMHEITP